MSKHQDIPEQREFLKKKRGRPAINKENETRSNSKAFPTDPQPKIIISDISSDNLDHTEVFPTPKNKDKQHNDASLQNPEILAKKEQEEEEIHITLMKLFGSTMAMMMKLNETVRSKVCVKCCCQNAFPFQSQPFKPMNIPLPQYGNPLFRIQKFPKNSHGYYNGMRPFNRNFQTQNMNFIPQNMTQMKRYPPKQ
jgi:hypothetical protein